MFQEESLGSLVDATISPNDWESLKVIMGTS